MPKNSFQVGSIDKSVSQVSSPDAYKPKGKILNSGKTKKKNVSGKGKLNNWPFFVESLISVALDLF